MKSTPIIDDAVRVAAEKLAESYISALDRASPTDRNFPLLCTLADTFRYELAEIFHRRAAAAGAHRAKYRPVAVMETARGLIRHCLNGYAGSWIVRGRRDLGEKLVSIRNAQKQ